MFNDHILSLANGHQLSYACYGRQDGEPAFYFHGLPGSRREGELLHAACEMHGIWLIAPERPGYGLSESLASDHRSSWPLMIAELASHLGIARFYLFAASGGAPYALACASELHEQVIATGICCGLGEVALEEMRTGMRLNARLGFWLARRNPLWLKLTYGLAISLAAHLQPGMAIDFLGWMEGEPDRSELARPGIRAIFSRNLQAAFQQGATGGVADMVAATLPWSFDLKCITNLYLWHGTADVVVPLAHSERLARLVPGTHLVCVEDEGHFSLPIRYAEAVVRTVSSS